jgi:Ca2+-binding RTX toxin-like protein
VRRLCAAAVVALGWWATPAPAATVSFGPFGVATYRAAPGEANRLAIDGATVPGATVFRDTGAPIEPGPGCTARPDGSVSCTAGGGFAPLADVDLGDGDDVVSLHGGGGRAVLGPGADRASADLGRLEVEGGPGPDAVSGAPGADVEVEYFDERAAGVRVTLDGRADDGAPGEGDDIGPGVRTVDGTNARDVLDARGATGVVSLYGNGGDDRLYASPRGGSLYGATGADVLHGGPGRDTLDGEANDDVLSGGGGDDVLDGENGRNVMTGGPGHDRIWVQGNGHDAVYARDGTRDDVDCVALPHRLEVEATDRLTGCAFPVAPTADPPRLLAHRRLRLLFACRAPIPGGCRGTLRLTDTAPQPLGRARFTIAAGHRAHVTVRLHHRPRGGVVTAVVVAHRTQPPASSRATVTTLRPGPF